VVRLAGHAVTALVQRDDPASGRQAVELVVEHLLRLSPAVEHDQREPFPELLDEQGDAVCELDLQLFASFQSSPTPMSTASGGSSG